MELNTGKKVLLVSSGQPSLNPRLVKEADALVDAGYNVTVFYAYWNAWGTNADKLLLSQKKWTARRIGGDPVQQRFLFLLSRLIHKLAVIASKKLNFNYCSDLAIARSSYFLIRAAKKFKAHLYIGHNLGALPAVVKAARTNGALCGFDAEDFHRYEVLDDDSSPDVRLKTKVENNYIPPLDYLVSSSPAISAAYKIFYPTKDPLTILNVFSNRKIIAKPEHYEDKPLQLFWFSQTVGYNRGLEDILLALKQLNSEHFSLHLLGECPPAIMEYIKEVNGDANIHFRPPIPPDDLISYASQFDIGLALEPGFSINNDLALSNKIFTYLQAGLAVVASDTSAQKGFYNEYPAIGKLYERGNINMLATILSQFKKNPEVLKNAKLSSQDTGNLLSWEEESKKFIALINGILPA